MGAVRTLCVGTACAIFVALYALVLAQLAGRSFGISFLFTEDAISILFVWFVMSGAVVAYLRRDHLDVDLLHTAVAPALSRRGRMLWRLVIVVAELIFLGVFCYALWLMAGKTWNAHYGALPGFRYGYLYAGVLVAMLASMAIVVGIFISRLRGRDGADKDLA